MPRESVPSPIEQAFKRPDRLISGVSKHLLSLGSNEDRRTGYLHPSELSSEHFCPRKAYYDISGEVAEPTPRNLAFEMVFERGHDSHDKWQQWFWDMGDLRGMFQCLVCGLYWYDRSPWDCPRCESGRDLLKYKEVPVSNDEYGIAGNADGDVWWKDHWTFIEVKTIGIGTIRWDAPTLLEKYSFSFVNDDGKRLEGFDLEGLWAGIKRPFRAHLKQGMVYCFCADRKEMVYIYDPKFLTKFPKEFEIKFREEFIEDVLEDCLKVKDHLQKGRPPKRRAWAEKGCRTCRECPFRSKCYERRVDKAAQPVRQISGPDQLGQGDQEGGPQSGGKRRRVSYRKVATD